MKKEQIPPVRGMHDILPDMMRRHKYIIDTAYEVAQLYGFEYVETPIVEFAEVFKRSLGNLSDVVNKEMYLLHDRKGKELVLRPENTASIVRALISNGLQHERPQKFFYNGPMFRYERPQKGRQRQFHQIGVEFLGSAEDSRADIDVIACGYEILRKLNLSKQVKLQLNTLGGNPEDKLPEYRQDLVNYLKKHSEDLSEDSKIRLEKNPVRILDSKDNRDKEIVANAPSLNKYLSYHSRRFFDTVKAGLHESKVECEVYENPFLVRGLDYYRHTVFEFVTDDLGAQGTVLAGGRYDGLVKALGGENIDGVGWAAGVERLALLLEDHYLEEEEKKMYAMLIAPFNSFDYRTTIACFANRLRSNGVKVEISDKPDVKRSLSKANKKKIPFAIIFGGEQENAGFCELKDMKTGIQEKVFPSSEKSGIRSVYKEYEILYSMIANTLEELKK